MDSSIQDINTLLAKINELGGNSKKALKKSIGKEINFVKREAKMLCPVDTGALRNSIRSVVKEEGTGIVAEVVTNLEYASYVEFGTGIKGENSPSPPKANVGQGYRSDWVGQAAQPFLYPALANNKDKVLKQVRSDLIKEIGRLCSK